MSCSDLCDRVMFAVRVAVVRHCYARVERRLRALPAGRMNKVVFLVSEIQKWKVQKVYDLMAADLIGHDAASRIVAYIPGKCGREGMSEV